MSAKSSRPARVSRVEIMQENAVLRRGLHRAEVVLGAVVKRLGLTGDLRQTSNEELAQAIVGRIDELAAGGQARRVFQLADAAAPAVVPAFKVLPKPATPTQPPDIEFDAAEERDRARQRAELPIWLGIIAALALGAALTFAFGGAA
jgi:hypothetical protein